MKIIRLGEEKAKSSAKITKLKDGGYIVSVSTYSNGYIECDSIFIPSGVEIDLNINN